MTGFLPYGRQDINDEDIAAVSQVLKSDFLTQGPAVDSFELALCKFLECKHAVAVSNGTAALHIAYLAAGIGKGDAVIVPAITFAATSNAVLYCGATPVFADVDPRTGGISCDSIERCIGIAKKNGLKVKAIAPVHFAGLPCDMTRIAQLATKHQLMVIEDACHAVGAEYRLSSTSAWQKVGSADFSTMATFSFHPVKHITTGEGGTVTTSDPQLAKKLRLFRSHGITKNHADFSNRARALTDEQVNLWYMEMQELGYNYRLCDIQAVLGESQLKRASKLVDRRRQIAHTYDRELANLSGITPAPGDTALSKHSYHLYPLKIDFAAIGYSQRSFMAAMRELGIGSQVLYIPVPYHPYYENHRDRWLNDHLNAADNYYHSTLSIPMFPKMSDQDVARVVTSIKSLVKSSAST